MKAEVLVAATGLAVAQASMASLRSNLKSYAASHNNNGRAGAARALGFEVGFEPINGYGCWCYLDSNWRDVDMVVHNKPSILAKGRVVDAIDESCRNLINSYKCIEMDAEANGIIGCDAQAVDYTPYNFGAALDLKTECETNNAGQCAQNACIVEAAFTLLFLDLIEGNGITDHAEYNVAHTHSSKGLAAGTFDPEVSCPGIPNPVGSDKKCCGMHSMLTRHPYRLDSGFTTRSCCDNQVINNELNQCCGAGTAASPEDVVDINEDCAIINQCSCDHGEPDTENCEINLSEKCGSCDDGFFLENGVCMPTVPPVCGLDFSSVVNPPETSRSYSSFDSNIFDPPMSMIDAPGSWMTDTTMGWPPVEWMVIDLGFNADVNGLVVQGTETFGGAVTESWLHNFQVKYWMDGETEADAKLVEIGRTFGVEHVVNIPVYPKTRDPQWDFLDTNPEITSGIMDHIHFETGITLRYIQIVPVWMPETFTESGLRVGVIACIG